MHTEASLEERIRHRYHQPKGVEQFGIEPIPEEKKVVGGLDIFSIILGLALNPGSILVGGLAVVSGLSFLGAVSAIAIGMAIAVIAYTIMATVGVDYGLPGQVGTRMAYGLRGAKWIPSFIRTFASIYWFAFQTVAGSIALIAVLERWIGGHYSLVTVSLLFALLQAFVAIVGYDSLKQLSRAALPLKIGVLLFALMVMMTHDDPNFAPSAVLGYAGGPKGNWLLFVTWLNVTAANSLTMVTDSADFCRYTRGRFDMWWGTAAGKWGGSVFSAILGAYAAAATQGKVANMFQVVAGLTSGWLPLALLVLVIALDNWTINVLNLYTGGLSLSNIFERLGRFWTTLIISILGIALSVFPDVVNGYTSYVGMLGNFFSPIAGVLVADYLLVKRMRIDVVALFERSGPYWYWRGFNPIAVLWTVAGFLIYMFVIPQAWIQTLCTLLITAAGYWLTTRLVSVRSGTMARASRPGEQRESIDDLAWDLAAR
ncbi:MAG TPA: cytosine permease [Rhodopila sp.]|uniref:purine-cytosine permease family protein n=1 Tax=Rhodopila sp. TaxID=2480087 RepID=UPI002C70A6DE|nr:cytosine permease [Rhodopila sp.]HVY15075.1 cytosine permease [Rhodopila sp.]